MADTESTRGRKRVLIAEADQAAADKLRALAIDKALLLPCAVTDTVSLASARNNQANGAKAHEHGVDDIFAPRQAAIEKRQTRCH